MDLIESNEDAMDTVITKQKIVNDAHHVSLQVPEFVCKPGDPRVASYGWKMSKFEGFLSLDENTVWISVVISRRPGRHRFSRLIKNLHDAGFTIKVPRPTTHMSAICRHLGFEYTEERGDITGAMITAWVLPVGEKHDARKK